MNIFELQESLLNTHLVLNNKLVTHTVAEGEPRTQSFALYRRLSNSPVATPSERSGTSFGTAAFARMSAFRTFA